MSTMRAAAYAGLALTLASCQQQEQKAQPKPVEDPASSSLIAAAGRSRPLDPVSLTAEPNYLRIPLDPIRAVSATATVVNSGDRPAEGLALRVTPGNLPIAAMADCLRGPLQPGATCKIEVTANPSRAGVAADVFLEGPGVTAARIAVTTMPPAEPVATTIQAPPPPDPAEVLRRQMIATELTAGWGFAPPAPAPAPTVPVPLPPAAAPVSVGTVSPPRDMARIIDKSRYITLTLENEILTTRQGTFTAVVALPIYENPAIAMRERRSPRILLDQGTRFNGDYDASNTVAGRNMLRLTEFRDPRGRTMRLQGLQSMDPMGRAGTPADVEQLGVEKFAAGLLGSIVSLVPLLTVSQGTQQSTSALGTVQSVSPQTQAAQKLSQDISDLTRQAIHENLDRLPRAGIPAGSVIMIQPDNDWYIPSENDMLTATLAPPQPPQAPQPAYPTSGYAPSGYAPSAYQPSGYPYQPQPANAGRPATTYPYPPALGTGAVAPVQSYPPATR